MLDFFDASSEIGTVSIYEAHMTFNKTLLQYFSECYRVRVGIDKDAKKVHVFLLNKDTALSGEYKESSLLPVSTAKSYARVCSRAMVEYISKAFDLKIGKGESIKFTAEYEELKKVIIIDIKGVEE